MIMTLENWLTTIVTSLNLPLPDSLLSDKKAQERILKDPYYRLQSQQEVQLAAKLGLKIDVNQATVDDWLRLPGLSIHQARALAQLTRSGVHFYSVEDMAAALGLSPRSLAHLEPVLAFCYYNPEEPLTIPPVNVNTASIEELTRIPAVDLFLARTIVKTRQTQGAYRNLAELQQRLTLPPHLVSELLHYLRFGC